MVNQASFDYDERDAGLRELACLVDLPELPEAADLALAVAPRTRERGQPGARHVGRVDLDERVHEIVPERSPLGLPLEPDGNRRLPSA